MALAEGVLALVTLQLFLPGLERGPAAVDGMLSSAFGLLAERGALLPKGRSFLLHCMRQLAKSLSGIKIPGEFRGQMGFWGRRRLVGGLMAPVCIDFY